MTTELPVRVLILAVTAILGVCWWLFGPDIYTVTEHGNTALVGSKLVHLDYAEYWCEIRRGQQALLGEVVVFVLLVLSMRRER